MVRMFARSFLRMQVVLVFIVVQVWNSSVAIAQPTGFKKGVYRVLLQRSDGNDVAFVLKAGFKRKRPVLEFINAEERLQVTQVVLRGDSLLAEMPAFESWLRVRLLPGGNWEGVWERRSADAILAMSLKAVWGVKERFPLANGTAEQNLTGRWEVSITRPNGTLRPAVAELKQKGNRLTGTFLTPSGDYRYLEGIVSGNQMKLSCFDGTHAFSFTATVTDAGTIRDGFFYNGATSKESWVAVKNADVTLPEVINPATLKPGYSKLDFAFRNLEGRTVSINDARFQNKVVVVQIMGSWCPNCMDETRFLSDYYNKNKDRGVEVVALAYEYTADFQRSVASLRKFQQLFNVQYPMLITGVAVGDEQRTEKTLPQLTPIRSFPTTIYIDKKGMVRYIHNTFYGPATGALHEAFRKSFELQINALLAE